MASEAELRKLWYGRARLLMEMHGLGHWDFQYSTKKTLLGQCFQDEQRIELSVWTLTGCSADSVTDTILHEIAHGLTYGHGHDEVWAMKAEEIGATPEACYKGGPIAPPKWKYVCSECVKEWYMYRKPKDGPKVCRKCSSPVVLVRIE